MLKMLKKSDPPLSKINQQLIADELKISRTTVSRCFTNHPGISPVTRAKVFDLASQLGYQHMEMKAPKKAAPVVQKTVGLLVCTEVEEYFRSTYQSPGMGLLEGASEFAQLHKIKLDVHYVNPTESSLQDPSYRKIEALQSRHWHGVLLVYPFPRQIVDAIDLAFPVVSLVEQYGGADIDCVDVDHYRGVSMMIDQLAAQGHQRIGFLTRHYAVEAPWSLRRFSAYVEKMTRLGLNYTEQDLVNVRPDSNLSVEESVAQVAGRVMAGTRAWVCAADHQAYDLIAGLQKLGLRPGKEVSITGFDGIAKPDWAPSLTTAMIPYREIGYTGGKRLLDLMQKRFGSSQHIWVASRVHPGQTIGPVGWAPEPKILKKKRSQAARA